MKYRKFKATRIFDGYNYLPESTVVVTDAAGKVIELTNIENAGDEVEIFDGILTPGFINCHCHLELSHLKSKIDPGTGLVNFVSDVMKLRSPGVQLIQNAIEAGELEMFNNGIVAVGDICNTANTVLQKQKKNLAYYNFIEATGFLQNNADERFDHFKVLQQQFIETGASSIVPHAPYSVSQNLLKNILLQQPGRTISMHNQESDAEHEFFTSGSGDFVSLYNKLGLDISFYKHPGCSSLRYFFEKFDYKGNIILVHNLTTTDDDIKFAEAKAAHNKSNLYWCFCMNANEYISGSFPAIEIFYNNNVNIVLGTDSLASNSQLSIFAEMKTFRRIFFQIKSETLLRWATINGAKALQMDDHLGSFETGKTPGIVLIENLSDGEINAGSTLSRLI